MQAVCSKCRASYEVNAPGNYQCQCGGIISVAPAAPVGGAPMGGMPMGGMPVGGAPMGGMPMGGMSQPGGSYYSEPKLCIFLKINAAILALLAFVSLILGIIVNAQVNFLAALGLYTGFISLGIMAAFCFFVVEYLSRLMFYLFKTSDTNSQILKELQKK